jgi:hypothetical protein
MLLYRDLEKIGALDGETYLHFREIILAVVQKKSHSDRKC